MRAFYFIVLLTSITTNAQNYLDFYFKSRGVKGGIIIQSDTGDYIAFSDDFEGNKPSPPAATFHMFSYLMVYYYISDGKKSLFALPCLFGPDCFYQYDVLFLELFVDQCVDRV